jgi:hypothetical protein
MPKTKKNSPLKASLAAHQARVAKKAKEEEGRKSAYVKNLGGKNKNKKKDKGKGNANVTIPFTKAEKILLVGEGIISQTSGRRKDYSDPNVYIVLNR